MSQNKARTPFDDPDNSGVDVPLSKNTQPLPSKGSLPSGLQSGVPTGNIATSQPSAQPTTPSAPVAPAPVAAPATPSAAQPTARLKVPLPTVIGLAVTGGVLLATVVPMLVRRAIPTVAVNTFPTPIATPLVPGQAPEPPTLLPKDDAAFPAATTQPTEPGVAPSNATVAADPAESTPALAPAAEEATEAPAPPAPRPRSTPTAAPPRPSTNAGTERTRGVKYSIAPPTGWKKTRSGRRTSWEGPGDATLLVEVSDDIGSSPREDWEKLDRGFRKSYGSRYRNLGIRNTTLAGRPAAAWEFELTSKSGVTTRKIDIAVHDGGRGFAVLGSAPAADWDEARADIEEAINSFELSKSAPRDDSDDEDEAPARAESGF